MVNTSIHFQHQDLPDQAIVRKMFGYCQAPYTEEPTRIQVEILSMRLCRDVTPDKFFVLDVIKHPRRDQYTPFSIPAHSISDMWGLVDIPSITNTRPPAPTMMGLAEELITKGLDKDRVHRAYNIATSPHQIYNQKCPTGCYDVRAGSGRGWYRVNTITKECSCTDSQIGNVCKHRIAVFLNREVTTRIHEYIKGEHS